MPEVTTYHLAQPASPQGSSSLPSYTAPLQGLSGATTWTCHSPPLQMELLLFFFCPWEKQDSLPG